LLLFVKIIAGDERPFALRIAGLEHCELSARLPTCPFKRWKR
jgi:hypothetical protein